MSNPDDDRITSRRRTQEEVAYREAVGALARLLGLQEDGAARPLAYHRRAKEILWAHLTDGLRSQLVLRNR